MAVKVTCINKDGGNHNNPHEAVSHYGWVNEATGKTGKTERVEMVQWVEAGDQAYVGSGSAKVVCEVRVSVTGIKFLQTVSDGSWSNNLLSLPECL